MARFKSKKKRIRYFLLFFLFFSCGFFFVFSFFIEPKNFFTYFQNEFFSEDEDIVTWYLKSTFASFNEEEDTGLGKTEYIPDPNPLENKVEPLIYIYNTHQTEEYYIDLLMEHDIIPSVMTASYILRENLNKLNIPTMVETENIKDLLGQNNWNYTQSYKASRILLEKAKENYPSLKYYIDVHRDSIAYENSTLSNQDEVMAKVLFVIGKDFDGYERNKDLANRISNKMNEKVKGISKGILEKGGLGNNGIYNQDFDENTILIEVGSSYNSIGEVLVTMKYLAESIKEVINN